MPGEDCTRQDDRVQRPMNAPEAPEVATPTEIHDVRITKVENGFILYIGCKTFIATNWEHVSTGVDMYFKNPVEARKKYCT